MFFTVNAPACLILLLVYAGALAGGYLSVGFCAALGLANVLLLFCDNHALAGSDFTGIHALADALVLLFLAVFDAGCGGLGIRCGSEYKEEQACEKEFELHGRKFMWVKKSHLPVWTFVVGKGLKQDKPFRKKNEK